MGVINSVRRMASLIRSMTYSLREAMECTLLPLQEGGRHALSPLPLQGGDREGDGVDCTDLKSVLIQIHPHPTLLRSGVRPSRSNPALGIVPRALSDARIFDSRAHRFAPLKGRAVMLAGFVFAMFASVVALAQTHTQSSGAMMAKADSPLRVCADPNDLPFSNHAEQGFENKLAHMLAQSLSKQIQFVWHTQGKAFLRDTLNAGRCDVVMGLPTDDHAYGVLTTDPYYRSAYALIYRASAPYKLKSLDDPRLRSLQIGVHATGDDWVDLPGGATLAQRGIVKNVHVYKLFADYGRPNPSADLIEAVADGEVDAAIAWGPLAGYFATREPVKLTVVPLMHTDTVLPFQFSISMAVRHGDIALRGKLNAFLKSHRAAIHKLLADYGVPQLRLNTVSFETNTHTPVAADR